MKWLSIEIGIPLMLTGIIMYAIGLMVDYLTQTIQDVSYPFIRFITLLGMLFVVIGGSSILNIGKVKE